MSPRPKRGDTWTCTTCGAVNEPTRKKCMNGCGNGLQIFEVSDSPMRFGVAEDGRPYVIAEDFTPQLGYSRARNALRMVDADEKGAQIVSTPGGPQRMDVLYEDGIWELIFLSRKPEAREIKKRVKAILRQIRETGSFSATAQELTRRDLAAMVIEEADRADQAEARIAAIAPAADAWEALSQATGDYSVREAAQILDRDPAISTGQNRLFKTMHDLGWIDGRSQPYQSQVDLGRLVRRTDTYDHPKTGEPVLYSQIRITAKGLTKLRDILATGPDGQLDIGGA